MLNIALVVTQRITGLQQIMVVLEQVLFKMGINQVTLHHITLKDYHTILLSIWVHLLQMEKFGHTVQEGRDMDSQYLIIQASRLEQ